jgi:hypothetical protein
LGGIFVVIVVVLRQDLTMYTRLTSILLSSCLSLLSAGIPGVVPPHPDYEVLIYGVLTTFNSNMIATPNCQMSCKVYSFYIISLALVLPHPPDL